MRLTLEDLDLPHQPTVVILTLEVKNKKYVRYILLFI